MIRTCKAPTEELDNLHPLDESSWFMRSRSNELKDGDKNTKYFHHKASSRRRTNLIKGLNNMTGEWKTDKQDLMRIFLSTSHIFSLSAARKFWMRL